jgi:DNA replication protein DnaC
MMSEYEPLINNLRQLGFRVSDDALSALLKHAVKSRLSAVQALEQLVQTERQLRDSRNLAARLKKACLGTVPSLDRFDWTHPTRIDQAEYERLLSLDFVRNGHNVLFRGPSGVGKTNLAQILGVTALENGLTVRMSTIAGALADLLQQESLPATQRRLRRYTRPDLLILDELGYLPCDSRAADMLFNIIADRHEKKSVVITTNLPYKRWGDHFSGAGCVTALVDRFAQHCHTLDIEGSSWRQKHTQKKAEAPPTAAN